MKWSGTWRNNLKKLICGATALALVFCLLPVGALAAGEAADEPAAAATGQHIEPLKNVLASDDFTDVSN